MGPSTREVLFVMMSRLINRAEVEVLPTYHPTQAEKADPFLFSRNVRDYMGKAAKVPVTDHSYEDCRLMQTAHSLGLPMDAGLVEYYKLSPMIGMNCDCMIDYMKKFAEIDSSKDGKLDLEEFCDYLHLPISSEEVKTIFRIYDIDGDNLITFREYLLGFTLISRPFNTEENIETAFAMFDPDNTGHIEYDNFSTPIQSVLPIEEKHIKLIYKNMNAEGNGKVTKDSFRTFCLNKPEYALLFIHFRHLKERSSSMTFSRPELRRTSVTEADTEIMPDVQI
ncbi:lysophosphatidylcholine acyltransferase 2-like [Clytia hemisphaerica]|uniref:EF-hand domain-containing protein n=1 Tax=Clytia hemisphaerica TaxID=252671 RepID=A0A7M5X548_9CNID